MPKILIIEDEKSLREILRMALEGAYTVRCAADGETGVQEVATWQPDVVITDYALPGRNGIDVIKEIRSGISRKNGERKNEKSPGIVLFSAIMSTELEKAGRKAGADWCLPKPFDLTCLQEVIKELIGRKRFNQGDHGGKAYWR